MAEIVRTLDELQMSGEYCAWPNELAPLATKNPGGRRGKPLYDLHAPATARDPKRSYMALRAAGICTRCRRGPARPGRAHCEECADYVALKQRLYVAKHPGYRKHRRR